MDQKNEGDMLVDENKQIKFNQKMNRKQHYNEVSHIFNITRFQTLFYLFFFFLFLLVPGFILTLGQEFIEVNPVVILIYLLILLFLVYSYMTIILVIMILFPITYRTRCLDFFIQLLVYSQFGIVSIFLIPLFLLPFPFQENSLFAQFAVITNFTQFSMLIWIISFLILLIARRSFRKPIFWLDSLKLDKLSIITYKAAGIHDVQNGFSQRPLFLPFTELIDYVHNVEEFRENFQNYAKFLARKGEFIDWLLNEKSVHFYPRFLIRTPNILFRPFSFLKFWNNLRTKRDLTTIELDYVTKNLSIRISSEDYNLLKREVTFHLLMEKVLESLKESMIIFLEGDLDKSYNVFIKI